MGDRLFASAVLRRVPGGVDRTRAVLRDRGGLGVLLGRFVAIVRAIMPAAAGAAPVRYATFLRWNLIGGVIWGVGYTLLGYLAGSAYTVVEKRVGVGLAVAVAVVIVAAVTAWAIRRHRRAAAGVAVPAVTVPTAAPPAAAPAAPAPPATAAVVPAAAAQDSSDPGVPEP